MKMKVSRASRASTLSLPVVFVSALCLLLPAVFLSCASTSAGTEAASAAEEPVSAAEPADADPAAEEPVVAAEPVQPEPEPEAEEEQGYSRSVFAEKLLALLEAGDFEAALALFDTVPEPDASSADILKLKLSVLISSGDLKAALALANDLEKANKDDVDVLYAQAMIALAQNKTQRRSQYLKKIVALEPKNTDALLALATDSMDKRAYGDARKWLQQAVDADSENTEAWRALVHACYMQDKLDDAREIVDAGIAEHPEASALWLESALIHSEKRDLPEALADIRHAISLDSSVASYWTHYGIMLVKASKFADARDAFNESIKLNPDDYFPYIYRCGLNDNLGYTEEALADYRFVCKRFPQYYYASEGLGVLLWLRGDYSGAKNAFAQAGRYAPDEPSYALMYTLCCYKLNQDNEARRFIGKYLNTLDRDSTEYFVCRLFYDKTGDSDVMSRITREKDADFRAKYLFYVASYYELFQSPSLAEKIYSQITDVRSPTFFEYRLAEAKLAPAEESATEISGIVNAR